MNTKLYGHLISLLILVTSSCSSRQNDGRADVASETSAVEQTVSDWLNIGIASQDTTIMKRYMAPTFHSMEPDGWFDRISFLKWIMSFKKQFGGQYTIIYKLHDWHTTIHGDVAWTSLKNDGILTVKGVGQRHMQWDETAVLVKQSDGRWLIAQYHSTYLGDVKPK